MTYVPSASTPSHCSCPAGIMSESGVTKPWPEGYGDAIGITHAVSQHTLDKVEYVLELTKKTEVDGVVVGTNHVLRK